MFLDHGKKGATKMHSFLVVHLIHMPCPSFRKINTATCSTLIEILGGKYFEGSSIQNWLFIGSWVLHLLFALPMSSFVNSKTSTHNKTPFKFMNHVSLGSQMNIDLLASWCYIWCWKNFNDFESSCLIFVTLKPVAKKHLGSVFLTTSLHEHYIFYL